MSAPGLTYKSQAQQAASANNIPFPIFSALIDKLSKWSQSAGSSTGAVGLTGITQTQASLALPGSNVYDPVSNLDAGAARLSQLYTQTGSWPAALAQYPSEPGMSSVSSGGDTGFASSVMQAAQAGGYTPPGAPAASSATNPVWKFVQDAVGLGHDAYKVSGLPGQGAADAVNSVVQSSGTSAFVYIGVGLALVVVGYFAIKSMFQNSEA